MSDSTSSPPGQSAGGQQLERYEVVLEPAAEEAAERRIARVSALDLDRLPDRENVRLLVDAEQLARLEAAGLTARVVRTVPVQPLDPALIADDAQVTDWLSTRLGSAGSTTGEGS